MSEIYRHRQTGYVIMASIVTLLALVALITYIEGLSWGALVALTIAAVVLALSGTLTVTIDRDTLGVRFGIGIIRKRFRLRDIESCRRVRSRWYYGWGVRLTPHGWLFSVSGFDAVEIVMKTGRKYRIGTDEPEALEAAIAEQIRDGN